MREKSPLILTEKKTAFFQPLPKKSPHLNCGKRGVLVGYPGGKSFDGEERRIKKAAGPMVPTPTLCYPVYRIKANFA